MGSHIETLEPRRLLAGGVDPTFGSATGAAFDAPGETPVLHDSAVDRAGRVVLAGRMNQSVSRPDQVGIFVGRLNTAGQPDPKFGVGGVIAGTPRGLAQVDFIVPLKSGGYIVAQDTSPVVFRPACRLMRLKPNGYVDPTFGRNGVVNLLITPAQVLEQPADGKLLIVGSSLPRDPQSSDASGEYLIVRLNADGTPDSGFGEGGSAFVANTFVDDQFFFFTTQLTSASLDSAGRIVLALFDRDQQLSETRQSSIGGSTTLFVRRFLPDGTRDESFGDAQAGNLARLYDAQWGAPPEEPKGDHLGIAVTRPDGQIAVLERDGTDDAAPPLVRLVSAGGIVSPTTVDLGAAVLGFSVPRIHDGAMTALADNSVIIAGTLTSGPNASPALVRVKSDLTMDTTFGNNGMLLLPTADSVQEAAEVAVDPDGTLTAVCNPARLNGERPGDVRVTRVFADDRPVVTFQRAKQQNGQLRLSFSIRGTKAIDTASLDDNDLRLQDAFGARTKLRLANIAESAGLVIATYRVNETLLVPGPFSIRAIHQQVLDVDGHGNASREIGTIFV